jgi:hypothetical protein
MTDFPLRLDDVLHVLAAQGQLHHLSVVLTDAGAWQASMKRPGGAGYRVVILPDIVGAILGAVGPAYHQTWVELLGPEFAEFFEPDEGDDDDLEDVLG